MAEYRQAHERFSLDQHFSREEVNYMQQVYTGIMGESTRNLDELYLVINSFQTQMTDGKRLALIAVIAKRVSQNLVDLRRFNDQSQLLSRQRTKEQQEIQQLYRLYGIPNQ